MQIEFQNAFVQIAAHKDFRDAFFAAPEAALRRYDLTDREIRALRGIPHDAFVRYADSLLAKRAREFSSGVPLTLRVCPSLTRRYRRWLALHPAPRSESVLPPGLREALRAMEALREELIGDPGEASYAADVFAVEILTTAAKIDGNPRTLQARFRADELLSEIRRGHLPMDPDPMDVEFRLSAEGSEWREC